MKKRIAFFVMILIITITTASCKRDSGDETKKIIVTSFFPIYLSTLNITKGVDDVKVVNMAPPSTGCLHDYQLTTKDLVTIEKSSIFVINGLGMESFMDKVLSSHPNLNIVNASKNLGGMNNEFTKNIDNTKTENPHVWVSITLNIEQVKNIARGLATADGKNSDKYLNNCEEYVKKLEELRDKMHLALDNNLKTRDIVTFHEAFPYFAREFKLNVIAVIEREPGQEQSGAELAETIKIINTLPTKIVFVEPQYSPKAAEAIVKETNAKIYTLDPIVTGPKNPPLDYYLTTMEKNLEVLKEALE